MNKKHSIWTKNRVWRETEYGEQKRVWRKTEYNKMERERKWKWNSNTERIAQNRVLIKKTWKNREKHLKNIERKTEEKRKTRRKRERRKL